MTLVLDNTARARATCHVTLCVCFCCYYALSTYGGYKSTSRNVKWKSVVRHTWIRETRITSVNSCYDEALIYVNVT